MNPQEEYDFDVGLIEKLSLLLSDMIFVNNLDYRIDFNEYKT